MSEHENATKSQNRSDNSKVNQPISAPLMRGSHPAAIVQRARILPQSLTPADVMQLQRTIGNQSVGRLTSEIVLINSQPVQKKPLAGIEQILRGKFGTIQRVDKEEEIPSQGKLASVQRVKENEEEEPVQIKQENNTGMPDNIKAGVENLSGIDMSDVRVHYNSDKPAEVGALAYTQGTDIHVASGQERHLPHEAWHVVQQKQGRVQPTMQLNDVDVNDDMGLEHEADVMGSKSITQRMPSVKKEVTNQDDVKHFSINEKSLSQFKYTKGNVIQRDACLIPEQNSPYGKLAQSGGVGPYEPFDKNQRFQILAANFQRKDVYKIPDEVDIQKDDQTGKLIIDPGSITEHIAQVDHILPKNWGGGNHPLNAQVLSEKTNSSKGDTYPWGGYSGYRVYDPSKNKIYDDMDKARKGGADLTTLDKKINYVDTL